MTAATVKRGGKRIGYVRVSTVDQHDDRQLAGVELDKVFREKVSGKNANREQLNACLDYLRDGDVLIVHSLDRLARNLDDLRRIVVELNGRGVEVQFIKENLLFTGEVENPMSRLLLSVMGAFAEFERALILERQKEGIAQAKLKGVYRGRKPSLSAKQAAEVRQRVAAGENKAQLARELGIARATLYQHLKAGDAVEVEL